MRRLFLTLFFLFSLPATAWDVDLGVAADYNIFVENDFTHQGWSDSQGKIAVGGNANITNYDVAVNYEPGTSREGVQFWQESSGYSDVLVVEGDLYTSRTDNIKGNVVLGGDLYYNGTLTSETSNDNYAMGEVNDDYAADGIDFDSAFDYLTTLSESLADMTDTGEIVAVGNEWWTSTQQFIFTPDQTAVDETGALILSIDADTLKNATDFFSSSLDPDTPIIVNVSGTNVDLDWVTYYDDLAQQYSGDTAYVGGQKNMPSNIIYNFYEAETITLNSGFYGNILAPNADFTFVSGDLSGQVIAKSWTSYSGAQANLWNGLYPGVDGPDTPGSGDSVVVSAPASSVLFFLGLCWVAFRPLRHKMRLVQQFA